MRLYLAIAACFASATAPALAQSPSAAPPPAPAAAGPSVARAEKVICRREPVIGSLIASKKTCHTATEWDRIADAARANATDMVDRNAGRPSGN